jgi:hypothetical protein
VKEEEGRPSVATEERQISSFDLWKPSGVERKLSNSTFRTSGESRRLPPQMMEQLGKRRTLVSTRGMDSSLVSGLAQFLSNV